MCMYTRLTFVVFLHFVGYSGFVVGGGVAGTLAGARPASSKVAFCAQRTVTEHSLEDGVLRTACAYDPGLLYGALVGHARAAPAAARDSHNGQSQHHAHNGQSQHHGLEVTSSLAVLCSACRLPGSPAGCTHTHVD